MNLQIRATRGRHLHLTLPISALLLAVSLLSSPLPAQRNGATPVRYTEAREHQVREWVTLPGSVEARTSSLLASEVAGKVIEFPVREGQRVEKTQVLARLNPTTLRRQLEAIQAELKEAQARLKLAEVNLERFQNLYESKIIPEQQLDSSTAESSAWKGRTEKLEADIQRIKNDLDQTTIRAPFAGTLVAEHIEVGEWVAEGGPIVEIVSLHPLDVRVQVPERFYRNLRLGRSAQVSFEALPGTQVKGRITSINPRADVEARTYPVKIQIQNRKGHIGVGMLAQVSFPGGELRSATFVPKDALVTRGTQQFVYRIQGENQVEQVSVETGAGLGVWIQVNGTVRPGEKIITRGNERVFPGQPVQGTPINYPTP